MENLRSLVDELVGLRSDEVVEKLQAINKLLLTNFEIKISDDIVIEPLRLEAYLFKNNFQDKFMHYCNKDGEITYGLCQRDGFGKLYLHRGKSGIDIILSTDKNFAYSCLIKNSRIIKNGIPSTQILKQYSLVSNIKEYIPQEAFDSCVWNKVVLKRKEKRKEEIVYTTIRNGLSKIAVRDDFNKEEQKVFKDLPISSLIELKDNRSKYDLETGHGADWIVTQYLIKYKEEHPDITINELNELRKKLYPNGTKKEFIKKFGDI